jgi:cysteine-rich repeat protein
MRRLGLSLALAACNPAAPNTTEVDLGSSTGTSSDDPSGIQTVTSITSSDASDEESASSPDPTVDPSTTTTAPDPSSTGDESSSTGTPAVCGDGLVEGDEECDDANDDEGDGCTTLCRFPFCGDGIQHVGEMCDDGDMLDSNSCTSQCVPAFCGDGLVWDEEEECDDADDDDTDDCRTNCKTAKCGDGVLWAGKEVCDDGFNDNEYNGCAEDCLSRADAYCGDGVLQEQYEHCDGPTGLAGVGCDQCLYDFSAVSQMACAKTCSWGGPQGCDQADADAFCKLRVGHPGAKATSFKTGLPTNAGGFPCSDKNVVIELDGEDPRIDLGLLTEFGINKAVLYQPTKIAQTHGVDVPVLQAKDLVCTP